jgi:tetratricopeptide (TPR) repeat protein
MAQHNRGLHPRLIPRAPDPRPSLAILPQLKSLGDDVAWAIWYGVWLARVRVEQTAVVPADTGEVFARFEAAAEGVEELRSEMLGLGSFALGTAEPRAASDALLRISEWAGGRGYAEAAVQCAEAAARLVPESSRRALAAGRTNRMFGDAARAELFYERAITLARAARNWRVYVRAHLGQGQVKKTLGDTDAARGHYFTAARAARGLSGEKWLAAQTQHDLLVLATEEGAFEEALRAGELALSWYPRHHGRIPALAHDIGLLLVRNHLYAPAESLLRKVMNLPIPPPDQVIGWSTVARAAAGIGDVDGYRQATEDVLRRIGLFDAHAAAAFENLAWAACAFGFWPESQQYATRSLEISESKGQGESTANARRVLVEAAAQRRPHQEVLLSAPAAARLLQLAIESVRALAAWRGPTWRRKRQFGPERLGQI